MSGITFRKIADLQGKEIVLFRLQNSSNAYVELINYGAIIVSIVVPDKYGIFENVILGYDEIEDYFSDTFYMGATIGRFANRIARAQFKLNGETFHLDKNDGQNSNHGGFTGFNKKVFDYQIDETGVTLSIESKDGEGGFPGNLQFSVTYSFSDDNELCIKYKGLSDRGTVFNPTNHAYFNLSAGKRSILVHELKVYADYYLEMNDEFLPTGNILPVSGSAFDFIDYHKVNDLMPLKKEVLMGYNTYFVRKKTENRSTRLLVSLKEISSGRILDVYSDMPGMQLYTGDYLSGAYTPFSGGCLEAQHYPDAPNHEHFPSCFLHAGEETCYSVIYKFCNTFFLG